ncbi:MAG: FAD-dependent monooxygenase [Moraxella sp.]|nr:FAD-dependent monooxygenase [Moraxella sp.]
MAKSNQQVIIIGGGHVGLSFALLLAHHGVASTVLERVQYPTVSPDEDHERQQYLDSRNTALSRRTVQIYQEIGLWDSLQSHACRIDGVRISEQGSFGRASLDKAAEGVESFGQVMENAWLGRQLLQAVRANPLVNVLDGALVKDITQTETTASVVFERQNHDTAQSIQSVQTLSSPLVVACDGQHSVARTLLGVGAMVHDYHQTGIVGVVETAKPHQHLAIERFTEQGLLAVLPLTDGIKDTDNHAGSCRRSVVWICQKGEEGRYLTDDAYFLQVLGETFGAEAGQFVKAGRRGAYPLAKVLADRQVVGRVVLMGNAAHTLHPVAGQGFNLCMRDAYAMAKILANAQQHSIDFGNSDKLTHYEQSRQKDQKRVIAFCDTVVHSFTHKNPFVKFGRNLGLLAFDKIPFVKPLVASYAMGLKS